MATETQYRTDDTFDDALAAYREVMERTPKDEAPPARTSKATDSADDSDHDDEPASTGTNGKAVKPETKVIGKADDQPVKGKTLTKSTEERDDNRDANGRFKSKTKDATSEGDDGEGEEVDGGQPASLKPSKAPASYSVQSKAAWNQLPPEVRDDILKREQEMQNGLAALKDFKDLKPWADMAARANTTINDALKRYVGIENVLKKDIGAGLSLIAQNFGLTQQQAAALFTQLGQKFGGGQANGEPDPVQQVLNPHLKPLFDQISALQRQVKAREEADQTNRLSSLDAAVKTLEADPGFPYVTDLMDDMTFLLENGRVQKTGDVLADLKAAYALAARLNPQVSEALIEQRLAEERETQRKKEQDAVAKAKAASRSVTGGRMPGTINTKGSDDEPEDLESIVRSAYRMHAG